MWRQDTSSEKERISTSLGSQDPRVKEPRGRSAGPGSFLAKMPKRALSELTKLKWGFSGRLSAVPSFLHRWASKGPSAQLSCPLLNAGCGLAPHESPAGGCAGPGGEGGPSGAVGPTLPLISVNNKPSWKHTATQTGLEKPACPRGLGTVLGPQEGSSWS